MRGGALRVWYKETNKARVAVLDAGEKISEELSTVHRVLCETRRNTEKYAYLQLSALRGELRLFGRLLDLTRTLFRGLARFRV